MRRFQGLCGLFLLSVAGCGGFFVPQTNSGGGTNTGDYIYVGNGNNTYLAGFGLNSSGALSVLSGSPYNNGVAAQSVAVTPANTFLYAGTTNGIYAYAINSNGSIAVQNSGSAVAQDMVATQMRVDSTGNSAGLGLWHVYRGPGNRHLHHQHHDRIADRSRRFSYTALHG